MLDFISVLTLSLGGVVAYRRLLDHLRGREVDEEMVFLRDLGDGWNLDAVTARIRDWRAARLIHPEWTQLQGGDVLAFAEAQRAIAVVMRLSSHRTWPVYVLRRWRTSPFPYEDPQAAGTGLIAPVFVGAVPSGSPLA